MDLRLVARLREHQCGLSLVSELDKLIMRAESLLERVEIMLPERPAAIDWKSIAFRWRKRNGRGAIEAVRHVHRISLTDLRGIDRQKKTVEQNTRQFVDGYPANNVLLTGARGTGKSSLIKALLNKYAAKNLRVIEVEKQDLTDLPEIVDLIAERSERFILYCDDLSFEADEPGYKALKVVLDGSVAAASENCLIYATSNRRHRCRSIWPRTRSQTRRRRDTPGRDGGREDLAI